MHRNRLSAGTSPRVMRDNTPRGFLAPRGSDRPALWIVLAAGVLLMITASLARGDAGGQSASRTDRFTATLPAGSTLRIENVSGEITARSGKEFQSVVTITVSAPTADRATELLHATSIRQRRENNDYSLETVWPLVNPFGKDGRKMVLDQNLRMRRRGETRCEDCKVTARYDVTVPPGVRAIFHTVNGQVRADGLDGDLELQTVNGPVAARNVRRSLSAHSVNGRVDVAAASVPNGAAYQLATVNGGVTLVLPRDARFDLSASTMSGTIATTFPLPAREEESGPEEPMVRRPPAPPSPPGSPAPALPPAKDSEDSVEVRVDLRNLERQIDQAMREANAAMERANREMERSTREIERQTRRIRVINPMRSYQGSIGRGGASIQVSTLNGAVLVLAEGTREADAKPLVANKRFFTVTVPHVDVHVRAPKVTVFPHPPTAPGHPDEDVVRGDVSGDFLSTTGAGEYQVGNVSGRVKISTRSGEVHVASVGRDAEIRTLGGDVQLGTVGGNLSARTSAGDIHCRSVAGALDAETAGGDIRVDRVEGSARAKTAGGDVMLPQVGGPLTVETSGGEVRAGLTTRQPRGAISIVNGGGDVTLTLPSDFRGDFDLTVSGVPGGEDETFIHSDVPELAVTRRGDSQRGTGQINGGGVRVAVRTISGEIRLRKAPAAGR